MLKISRGDIRAMTGISGATATGAPARSRAPQILDERFTTGELSQVQYREQVPVLGGGPA
ncbi:MULTISPECIES: hypothetical protein [Cryobacterium]|uniref:hypothetical protein n=1 Tax=Cryobacterium TaxID=69578 RepID=UPI001F540D2E|nr:MULTISPECIES: hypothetical protein [Cryobacterium]